MWPDAPIYTSLFRPRSTFPEFSRHDIRTSPLNRLPIDGRFRNLFFLYPLAFRSFGELTHDVVVSSSSGWAHGVRTRAHSIHAIYCHTPARWLYGGEHLGHSRHERLLRPLLGSMRRWDGAAASRADLYIANSIATQRRIRVYYDIHAPIVYPPVDVDRFSPSQRGERLLVVSRLLPYKRVDVIVDAATRAGIGLDVVGVGPALDDLRGRAGPTVRFHGRLDDTAVTHLMEACRAFCLPGLEDFGITPVEANAAGKPVVAYAGGGALETVDEGKTGVFFREYNVADVLDAIHRCDRLATDPGVIAASAQRFSRETFRTRLVAVLREACPAKYVNLKPGSPVLR